MSRHLWLKIRVTADERERIQATAQATGMSASDYIRQRTLTCRLRPREHEREIIRHLARIGANLNQLARWANTNKHQAESLAVLIALERIRRDLSNLRGTPLCT
ncbi:plasmid mobilization relaxosome protein MobC [Deltaproteobacteria bacterium Smac51]|nr:plasmid mobilization relaxosome protein MobC [Deltaproteobacteria bacterium Smac51]